MKYWRAVGGGVVLCVLMAVTGYAQILDTLSMDSLSSSSEHHSVYRVNYWVSIPIIVAGAAGGVGWWTSWRLKPEITQSELAAVNSNNVPSFDRISLHLNIANVPTWRRYADAIQIIGGAIPLTILADRNMRQDWLTVLTIGAEVNAVALGIYSFSPIGPHWIDRYRPLVYYSQVEAQAANVNQTEGPNKCSWYSGHVASVAASSFFVAKVYCDYHSDENKVLAYSLASVPSLTASVIRFMTLDHFPSDIAMGLAVGAACGVIIPELHRVENDHLSMGMFSSPTMGTGLQLQWKPELAKVE